MKGAIKMSWKDGLELGTPAYDLASSNSEILRTVAGPGTGKSFALRRRIARLLEEGADPERILAITFTRTAAADLRREIASLDVPGAEQVIRVHCIVYVLKYWVKTRY